MVEVIRTESEDSDGSGALTPAAGLIPPAWAPAGYTSAMAVAEWTSIGIESPTVAQQWADAAFTPEQAAMWVEVEDLTASEAVTAANLGVAPVHIGKVRRADPDWTPADGPVRAAADMGLSL